MTKKLIAVDIDEVLAFHAKALIAYSNKVLGTKLTIDDYSEHWSKMWQVDYEETARLSEAYHQSGDMAHLEHHKAADEVLRNLAKHYRMVIVTARRKDVSIITETWIAQHFQGIFEAIHHAGIWDKQITDSSFTATKADVCLSIGVDYLIDDQSKHCNAVAEAGIQAIMFGDYPWNRNEFTHPSVIKCADWSMVQEYFDGLIRS